MYDWTLNVNFPVITLYNSIKKDREAATQRFSSKKVVWKNAANLRENTHAEAWFQ